MTVEANQTEISRDGDASIDDEVPAKLVWGISSQKSQN
jgi:hypothetical protein